MSNNLKSFSIDSVLLLDQNYESLVFGYQKVWWNIALPLLVKGASEEASKIASKKILKDLGIDIDQNRFTWDLSGGEQRLITLCRFMLANPEYVLLDEPIANLDANRVKQVWRMVRNFLDGGKTVIMVSHQDSDHFVAREQVEFKGVNDRLIAVSKMSWST